MSGPEIHLESAHLGCVKSEPQPLFALSQRALRLLPQGDIAYGTNDPPGARRLAAEDRLTPRRHPAQGPIAAHHPPLIVERLRALRV